MDKVPTNAARYVNEPAGGAERSEGNKGGYMKKRIRNMLIVSLLLITPMLMGLTNMGSTPNRLATASVYDANIIDQSDTKVKLSWVTLDGDTLFKGYLGKGKVQIPFGNISYIEISKDQACIHLKEGKVICTLKINRLSRIYGKTPYGNYQIALKDIKKISFIKIR